ncbi:carbohydrate-binding protein [Edaphobacter acidisoli]|uniref:alpha-L-fucosidase n=2 Tax=Edaphobacter acidisoli TaxID=2040573 RepID=A0A916RRU6_9BACT|nr:carbohydrate-binding protein [Edaphobacter acidisoli]
MFVHFNMATFQDREWGDPTTPLDLFRPTALDTDQWAAAAQSANMTWACLTTRHHDGFCLWPTKTDAASVRKISRPVDIVRSYVDSFRKAGLRIGLYYSILSLRDDIRHFNVTPAKVELIKNQLTELFTGYGEIDILITDGWNAPWSRITYEEVPFQEIYDHIKSLQPNCLICDLNASQYPHDGLYYSDVKAFEQNAGQKVPQTSEVPALSCVTLTEGWFWKQKDVNGPLKPVKTVVEEWLKPLNQRYCNLILNAPPTREGRLAPNVVSRLREIGEAWINPGPMAKVREHIGITTKNLATGKPIHASSSPDGVGPDEANDGNFRSSWYLDEGHASGWLEVDLSKHESFNVVSLVEPVGEWDDYPQSRIRSYRFQCWDGVSWITLISGAIPAHTTIHRIPRVSSQRVRLLLESSTEMPHITEIGVYDEPD